MTIRRTLTRSIALTLAALGTIGVVTEDARACGGARMPEVEIDHRIDGIARAEKTYGKGEHVAAAASVIRMMPHAKNLDPKRSALVARAVRMLAVASARENGALPVGAEVPRYVQGTWLGKSEADRAKNLGWAVDTLRKLDSLKQDDPAIKTDLAEALAKVDAHRAEARTILEGLAKKDLIATPEAYAVLAELRRTAGDAAGGKLALARCEAMAKASAVCHGERS
jgi:hypothetical protein